MQFGEKVLILIWGSKQALVFSHKFELSIGIRAGILIKFHYLSVILDPK